MIGVAELRYDFNRSLEKLIVDRALANNYNSYLERLYFFGYD